MTSLTAPPIYNTNQISQVKTHTLRGKITGRWFSRSTATVPNLHRHEHSSTFRSIIISSPFRSLIFFFKICKIEICEKWNDLILITVGMVWLLGGELLFRVQSTMQGDCGGTHWWPHSGPPSSLRYYLSCSHTRQVWFQFW